MARVSPSGRRAGARGDPTLLIAKSLGYSWAMTNHTDFAPVNATGTSTTSAV